MGTEETIVRWLDRDVRLFLSARHEEESRAVHTVADELCATLAAWVKRSTELATDRLLPLKNDSWLDEDESTLSPEEFAERMSLESITLDASGKFTFSYSDGDLFWGHTIQVSGDMVQGPTHAGIAG